METIHAIFDLVGTLSNPAEGITKSLNHALAAVGCDEQPTENLLKYIGPPLVWIFQDLLGSPSDGDLSRAIEAYRERYGRIGFTENRLYPGIPEALAEIRSRGCLLHIATTKRVDFANQIAAHFGLDGLFTAIRGCDLHRTKDVLLQEILASGSGATGVMVGDRDSDFDAARKVGFRSIGVSWGFGSAQELAGADRVVDRPADLPDAVIQLGK